MQKPKIRKRKIETISLVCDIASGSRCKKAPPIKAPADKETRARRTLLRIFSLKKRVRTPIKEMRLIINVLININVSVCIFPLSFQYFKTFISFL